MPFCARVRPRVVSRAGLRGGSHAYPPCVRASECVHGAASVFDRTAEVILRLG